MVKTTKKSNKKYENNLKGDIVYSNKSIDDKEFLPENLKVSVSIRLDGDLLLKIKDVAKNQNIGYQTLINKVLREKYLSLRKISLEEKESSALLQDIKAIKKELKKLSKAS